MSGVQCCKWLHLPSLGLLSEASLLCPTKVDPLQLSGMPQKPVPPLKHRGSGAQDSGMHLRRPGSKWVKVSGPEEPSVEATKEDTCIKIPLASCCSVWVSHTLELPLVYCSSYHGLQSLRAFHARVMLLCKGAMARIEDGIMFVQYPPVGQKKCLALGTVLKEMH